MIKLFKIQVSYIYLAPILIILLPLFSNAQTSIGVKNGIIWGSVSGQLDIAYFDGKFKSYPSFCFGFDVKYREIKLLNLGVSIEYYMDDFLWYEGYSGFNKDIRYKIGYLRFTVFPEFIIGNKLQFYCNAGPYLSVVVNSGKKIEKYNSIFGTTIEKGSAKDDLLALDIGLKGCLGFGLEIIKNLVIFIESDGNLGLININDASTYGGAKTKGISVLAGLSYKLSRNKK